MTDLKAAAKATLIAELVTLPACTVKTVYQTNKLTIPKTILYIWNNHGIKGFYKASFPAISGQVLSTSSNYYLYRKLDSDNKSFPRKVVNGVAAGLLSTIITHPFDVAKVIWQRQGSLITEFENEGPKLLYRGYTKSLAKIVVGSGSYFPYLRDL